MIADAAAMKMIWTTEQISHSDLGTEFEFKK